MQNKIVTFNGSDLVVAKEVLEQFRFLHEKQKQLDSLEKQFKNELKDAMEKNGIKSIKNELFTASYIEEGTQTRFDTNKAKDFIVGSGLKVSDFEKETKVKSQVRVRFK